MILENRKPSSQFSHLVREFYSLAIDESEGLGFQPTIDDGCCDFVLFKEANGLMKYGQKQQEWTIPYKAFSIGSVSPPYQILMGDSMHFFTIKVQPWLNASFFPFLKQGINDLEPHYGKAILELHEAVFEDAKSFERQIEIAERFLESITFDGPEEIQLAKEICEVIYQSQGTITVQELAETFSVNRQKLNKQFKKQVLYTLKNFITIVRIISAVKYRLANPETSFTDLSYHFGYFDQAHFNYDFKRVCGVSPAKFFKKLPFFLTRHQ